MSQQMDIYLLRHGEAADRAPDGTFHDEARELTESGVQRLTRACRAYATMLDARVRMFHSPLIRAKQTADILQEAAGDRIYGRTEIEDLRPGGRATRVVDMLQAEFLDSCPAVVLVGHEPLLGDLLGTLSTGNDSFSIPMGKGMLASVRMTEPQVMIGRLQVLVSQTHAERLGS